MVKGKKFFAIFSVREPPTYTIFSQTTSVSGSSFLLSLRQGEFRLKMRFLGPSGDFGTHCYCCWCPFFFLTAKRFFLTAKLNFSSRNPILGTQTFSGTILKKNFFALRALKRGTMKSFLSKKWHNKVKKFLRAARAKKGYNEKLSKQKVAQ